MFNPIFRENVQGRKLPGSCAFAVQELHSFRKPKHVVQNAKNGHNIKIIIMMKAMMKYNSWIHNSFKFTIQVLILHISYPNLAITPTIDVQASESDKPWACTALLMCLVSEYVDCIWARWHCSKKPMKPPHIITVWEVTHWSRNKQFCRRFSKVISSTNDRTCHKLCYSEYTFTEIGSQSPKWTKCTIR